MARVTSLHVYPVKSCRGIDVRESLITPTGLEWDRRWMIVRPNGRFVTQREYPKLATISVEVGNGRLTLSAEGHPPLVVREKIAREGEVPDALLKDVTDLAGVRIIAYFPSDVVKIVPLIEKVFKLDAAHSMDKRLSSDPAIFGYASVHFVVEFRPEMLRFPEYALFDQMKCEIQVRTILQPAWAEIEHDIVYKSQGEIPFRVRRRFASLAGLLEIADREFESLRQDEMAVRKAIQSRVKKVRMDC